jgi:hypothetical protein
MAEILHHGGKYVKCNIAGMRLWDYPYIVLRIACRECPRNGRYRLAVLAEWFGADAETHDVLETISASCSARIDPKRGLRPAGHSATTAAGLAAGGEFAFWFLAHWVWC